MSVAAAGLLVVGGGACSAFLVAARGPLILLCLAISSLFAVVVPASRYTRYHTRYVLSLQYLCDYFVWRVSKSARSVSTHVLQVASQLTLIIAPLFDLKSYEKHVLLRRFESLK